MAFETHQSHGDASDHAMQPGEGRRATCERSIAFVLVLDEAAARRAEEAVATATAAKVAGVFVLVAPRFEDQVAQSVYSARRKGGRSLVQVLGYDPTVALDAACTTTGLELPGMPQSLVPTIRAVAESVLEDYEAAIVMDAAAEQMTPDRLREMCLNLQAQPDLDAVTPQGGQPGRPLVLISRVSLDRVD